eukprot:TRINITY_DN103_c0_g1_i2.p1 TRINITY_DN103_c0_g1~~TRINITY_DN103_c0_g1_i2.p1  ORF type:complete len:824 (-),score=282.95 TRINITY_DN103_c0_g1_i2:39-2471(-)
MCIRDRVSTQSTWGIRCTSESIMIGACRHLRRGASVVRTALLGRTNITFKNIRQLSSKPPTGFEKFQRKKRDSETEKKKEEPPVEAKEQNQTIEPEKHTKNEKAEKIEKEAFKRPEQEPLKDEKAAERERERQKEENATQFKEEAREEERDEKKEKKSSKGNKPPNPPPPKRWTYLIVGVPILFLASQPLMDYLSDTKSTISYTDFVQNYLKKGLVSSITISRENDYGNLRNVAKVYTKEGSRVLVVGNVDHFLESIEKAQYETGRTRETLIPVEFKYNVDMSRFGDRLMNLIYLVTIIGVSWYMIKVLRGNINMMGGRGGDSFTFGRSNAKQFDVESSVKVRFKDVAGLDEAKQEITEFVDFLKKPKKYKELGATIPRGALLAGPPGTGKTMLAKAAAGEAGTPFFFISGSDFVEMFVGVGASRVRDLFKQAKAKAPSIIFIDEIDAVGRKREARFGGGNDERESTLNQLLVEMDGFGTDTGVVIMAATNRKELLDPALTRPGRFDRTIEVTLPDIEGRKQIFHVHLRPLKLDPEKTIEEYARRLATLTPGFSGADIANLCNEAAIMAARTGKKTVGTHEFEMAAERVLAGLEKKKLMSEEERKTVAVHESGHAVVSWFLEGGAPLLKLTIIPRSKGSLGFAQYLPNESSLETKEELLDRICCILGGRCAEEEFFSRVTTGAYDDLKKVYDLARALVTKFGMSERLGYLGYHEDEYGQKHYSEATSRAIDEEVKRLVDECTERTRTLVKTYRDKIEKLSSTLLEKETLDLTAIVDILGERPFPPRSNFKAYLDVKRREETRPEEIPSPA